MFALLADARIGRKVRKAMVGILDQELFAGNAPMAVIDYRSERAGDFEIIVRRRTGTGIDDASPGWQIDGVKGDL